MERSNVLFTLYMSEIIFEVQNKTYLTGRSRDNHQNHEEVANMQANDDDENLSQIMRSIQNAFSTLKTKLSEYIVSNQGTGDNEQLPDTEEELYIALSMPTNYNRATVDTITAAMHQYIVNTAIADWFTITNKADAADYVNMSAANIEQIRESVNKRVRPVRQAAGSGASRYPSREGVGQVATPTFSPSGGTITVSEDVTISCTTPGAAIYYTTDGSTPTTRSELYVDEVALSATTTLKAIAVKDGMFNSHVATAVFTKV